MARNVEVTRSGVVMDIKGFDMENVGEVKGSWSVEADGREQAE